MVQYQLYEWVQQDRHYDLLYFVETDLELVELEVPELLEQVIKMQDGQLFLMVLEVEILPLPLAEAHEDEVEY